MAIHVRCLKLNFSKLSYFRALAAGKQTDSSKSKCNSKSNQHSLIVQFEKNKALTKHISKTLALTKSCKHVYSLYPRDETITSVCPITDSVTSLIPVDTIVCQSCNQGHSLSDIEHLIGSDAKDIAKPVSLSSDDIIIIQDEGSQARFQNDLEVISEILSKEHNKFKIRRNPNVDPINPTQGDKLNFNNSSCEPQTNLCSNIDNVSQPEGDVPEPADDPKLKLLETKDLLEKQLGLHFGIGKELVHWVRLYTPDVVLENNYWGKNKVYRGLNSYLLQVLKIRVMSKVKYVSQTFEILRITAHPEDQTIRVRWRFVGYGFKSIFLVPVKSFQGKKPEEHKKDGRWHDGFSIFYVQDDGRIYKHRVDRVMPDEQLQPAKSTSIATKLAILIGIVPKPSLNDFQSLLFFKRFSPEKTTNT